VQILAVPHHGFDVSRMRPDDGVHRACISSATPIRVASPSKADPGSNRPGLTTS
jgi:hypothetical protein